MLMLFLLFLVVLLRGSEGVLNGIYVRLVNASTVDEHVATLLTYSDDVLTAAVNITRMDSVHQIVSQHCTANCNLVMDEITAHLHGYIYTPTTPNSVPNDHRTTRIHVVDFFHSIHSYEKYLEIGTYHDELFNKAKTWFPYCVGVDPEQGGTHRMYSDDFFATNSEYFDLIFIDGSHEANQVFRDIHNSLEWLNPGGVIVMHDCNPRNVHLQGPAPVAEVSMMWTGDTWKAVVAMRLRPDVDLVTTDVDFGVAVLRKRPNRHPLPADLVELLDVSPISMLDYSLLERRRVELLRLVSFSDMIAWAREPFEA